MSLNIDVNDVSAILLPCGWIQIVPGSLDFDALEYHSAGREYEQRHTNPPEIYSGFSARDKATGDMVSGPVTSLLATSLRI